MLGLDTALANLQAGFGQAFSDLQITEQEVVEDGDALVIRGQNSGVPTGRFLGIEPTGRRVSWEYLDMYRAGSRRPAELALPGHRPEPGPAAAARAGTGPARHAHPPGRPSRTRPPAGPATTLTAAPAPNQIEPLQRLPAGKVGKHSLSAGLAAPGGRKAASHARQDGRRSSRSQLRPATCTATPAPPPTRSGGTSSTTPAPYTSPPTPSPSTSPCAATTPSSSTPASPTSRSPFPGGTTDPCASASSPADLSQRHDPPETAAAWPASRQNLNRISVPRIEVSGVIPCQENQPTEHPDHEEVDEEDEHERRA